MKIKISQLRRIIREEVGKTVGTTYECRTCGKHVSGRSDGSFDEPGWKRLSGIDGPDAICPDCVSDPHSLDSYRDEYPNVRIKEEVQRGLTEAKLQVGDKVEEKGTDSGWWEVLELIPDNRTGKTVAKLQMFQPVGGKKPITHVTTDKLAKVRESVSRTSQLKDGGVVNQDSGEILNVDTVPPKYLDHVEVDEMGYTTLPNDKFEELRGELKVLSAGKPRKQWKAPYQLNREKLG